MINEFQRVEEFSQEVNVVVNAKCPLGPYGSRGALQVAEGGRDELTSQFLDSFQLVSEIEFFLPSPRPSKTTLLIEMIPEGATT
jgi:hypothetical protein